MVGFSYKPSDCPTSNLVFTGSTTIAKPLPQSDWQCYLMGDADRPGSGSVVFVPSKGNEPNWFHRKMQELCFGIQWRKRRGN